MTRGGLLLFRACAAALVLAAVLHVATLLPRVGALADTLPAGAWLFFTAYALSTFTALAACALALLLLWKASHTADGRALALFLGFLAFFWGSLFRFLNITSEGETVGVNLTYGSGWLSESARAAWIFGAAAFVRFSALFPRALTPDRLPPVRRARWLRRLRAATLGGWQVWGAAIAIVLTTRYFPDVLVALLGIREDEQPTAQVAARLGMSYLIMAALVYVVLPLAAIVVGVRNLRASYRLAEPEERRRMLWVVTGFSLATWLIVGCIGGAILVGALDLPEVSVIGLTVLIVLAPLLLVLGCAMGVLYAGAIDPALALRRSTLYGALGALGLIAFAGIENALSALVERRLPLPGFVGPLAAGAIVAGALIPIQRRIRRAVAERIAAAEPRTTADAGSAPSVRAGD